MATRLPPEPRLALHGDSRDLRLDLLRGFASLAMIVDHVGGHGGLG